MRRTRLEEEQQYHDAQARARSLTFQAYPKQLQFQDQDYLSHETWIRSAFAHLGNLQGMRALDLGCGHGMASVVMARKGATVTALELSREYLLEAKRRGHVNGVSLNLIHGNGEQLPFAKGAFDRIWGNAILHHLDLPQAAAEIRRVLAPGGRAVLCEPWGENPLLRWARGRIQGKHTPDEKPFVEADLTTLRQTFPELKVQGYQFLSMVRHAMPIAPISSLMEQCDELLLTWLPQLRRFCRYVVLMIDG